MVLGVLLVMVDIGCFIRQCKLQGNIVNVNDIYIYGKVNFKL